ncbi:hypothetical protein D3C81_1526760 [compost metagenome]
MVTNLHWPIGQLVDVLLKSFGSLIELIVSFVKLTLIPTQETQERTFFGVVPEMIHMLHCDLADASSITSNTAQTFRVTTSRFETRSSVRQLS